MSGTSKGLAQTILVGARVSTHLNVDPTKNIFMSYTPANLRGGDGKKVNARLEIPVMVNLFRQEKGDKYSVIAWGRLADIFAQNLNRGKEMHLVCEPTSYLSNVRSNVDGSIIIDKNGQPLKLRRSSLRIINFAYGADSYTTEKEEIQFGIVTGEGKRPAKWNDATSPDYGIWKQLLLNRSNTHFSPAHEQKGYFGFAKVVMPKTPGYTILYGAQYDKEAVRYNVGQPGVTQTAPVQQMVMMPNTQTAPLVNQVSQVLNPNQPVYQPPVMQPVTQQPVMQAAYPQTMPGNAPF